MTNRFNTGIAAALTLGAVVFVLLLGGFFSGALSDDPPAVDPYAARASDETTTTTAAPATTAAAAETTAGTAETTTTTAAAAQEGQIVIEGFDFGAPIEVAVGQSVVVTNQDTTTHTWTATDGSFDSGRLSGGDTFETSFDQPGTFAFFCAIHPSMTGSITVTGS